jgi:hypothetical protein
MGGAGQIVKQDVLLDLKAGAVNCIIHGVFDKVSK